MTERPHFSQSQFRLAFGDAGCLRAYAYRYVDRISTPVPGRMHVGTCWDRMVNAVMQSMIDGIIPTGEEAAGLAVLTFDEPPPTNKDGDQLDYDFSDIEDIDSTRSRLDFAARMFTQQVAPTIRPLEIQVKVEREILDGEADLVGYIDLVELSDEGYKIVTDNKASMSGRASYNADKAIVDQQLLLYQALYALDAEDPDKHNVLGRGWRVTDIGYKKTAARFDAIMVREPNEDAVANITSLALASATDQARILTEAKRLGSFPPTGRGTWKCSAKFCDFYSRCPYGRRSRTAVSINAPDQDE